MSELASTPSSAARPLSASVVIPTFERPDFLQLCVRAIAKQTRLPDELIIVMRDTDTPTHAAYDSLVAELGHVLNMRSGQVTAPGIVPPLIRGLELASSDIVIYHDDDAEAYPTWLEKLMALYDAPDVVGAGGRLVNFFDFKQADYPAAKDIGVLTWYGRAWGNLYRDPVSPGKRDVQYLMGPNCSYRRDVLKKVGFDVTLNRDVAFHWEMDVGLSVGRFGRLRYDSDCMVKHHTAPRKALGLRTKNYDGVYFAAFNYCRIMRKHLTPLGLFAYLAHSFLIGYAGQPGLGYALARLAIGRPLAWHEEIMASVKGRVDAMRAPALAKLAQAGA